MSIMLMHRTQSQRGRRQILRRRRVGLALVAGLLLVLGFAPAPSRGFEERPCDPQLANEIVCENTRRGTPRELWDVLGGGDVTLQGFATDISVNHGEKVQFKVRTAYPYRIDVFRLGYYGGEGDLTASGLATGKFLQKAVGLHNLRLTWESPSTAYHVSFWMKNVADTKHINGAVDLTDFFGTGAIRVAPPRMWGFEVGYHYF